MTQPDPPVVAPDPLSESDLKTMAEHIDAADAEIRALCNGKKWRMSIPAQPDSDSDLVISQALCVASELLNRQRAASLPAPPEGLEALDLEPIKQSISEGRFVAYARTDIPALVGEVERLRALLSAAAPAAPQWIDSGSDIERLYAFLKVTNLHDAVQLITGLRERAATESGADQPKEQP